MDQVTKVLCLFFEIGKEYKRIRQRAQSRARQNMTFYCRDRDRDQILFKGQRTLETKDTKDAKDTKDEKTLGT